MKVLFLSPTGVLGGAERSLVDLVQSVQRAEPAWKVELFALGDGDLIKTVRSLGVTTHVELMPVAANRLGDAGAGGPAGHEVAKSRVLARLFFSAPQSALFLRKLRRVIRAYAPDVIHSNGLKTHILAAWTTPPNTALVWHVRDYISSRPLMSHLIRAHAHRCAVAIANSESVADDLDRVCHQRLRIKTVYNAIDLKHFNPEGPVLDLDSMCNLVFSSAKPVRVGLIATTARWKGHDVFLRAISMLPAQLFRGYIVGGPIYDTVGSDYSISELRALARDLRVEHRVGFTGFLSDPAGALRALDIVVHASTRAEPFGRVVAEAMACGKAVIASASGGVAEIIRDNENALSCPPGDAVTMAACINRLGTDLPFRHKMGVLARRWAEQRFDRARLAAEVAPIYRSVSSPA